MSESKPTKEGLLVSAIRELDERDRSIENIWFCLSGKIVTESNRLWNLGYDVKPIELVKGLRQKLNEVIEKEETE